MTENSQVVANLLRSPYFKPLIESARQAQRFNPALKTRVSKIVDTVGTPETKPAARKEALREAAVRLLRMRHKHPVVDALAKILIPDSALRFLDQMSKLHPINDNPGTLYKLIEAARASTSSSGTRSYSQDLGYCDLDHFKELAKAEAAKTNSNAAARGFDALAETRGESAFAYAMPGDPNKLLATVVEGLGTKNLVADAMYDLTGKSYDDAVAQDTVAMIVNDLITIGALPMSVSMHVSTGDSSWFTNKARIENLVKGWKGACDMAGATWAGGETPALKGIVSPDTIELSGSAVGIVNDKAKNFLTGEKIQVGDAIIIAKSSGIHANGLTAARQVADELAQGYLTQIDRADGNGKESYGEALLKPTIIYAPLIEECQKEGIDLHYAVNITGHGWRKLMRAQRNDLTYVIDKVPDAQPLFQTIQQVKRQTDAQMYADYNMGAGFAIYVSAKDRDRVLALNSKLKQQGIELMQAGEVKASTDEQPKVVIKQGARSGAAFKADLVYDKLFEN